MVPVGHGLVNPGIAVLFGTVDWERGMEAAMILRTMTVLLLAPAAALAQEFPPAPVVVATVENHDVAPRRTFVGTVRPSRMAVVGSEVAGRVVELLAEEGAEVKAGQPLLRVRSTRVAAELAAAKGELDARAAELSELENGSRGEDVTAAEERLASAEADLDFAAWQADSGRRMRETGALNEGEFRERQLRKVAAEKSKRVAELVLKILRLGPRPERIAAARARVAEQEALVTRIQDDLDRHTVTAPFDGSIVAKHTELGEWVTPGAQVVTIAALDEVDVRVGVVEDVIAAISVGDAAHVHVPALDGTVLFGRVHTVIPMADQRTRAFPVDVRIRRKTSGAEPAALNLGAGMFTRVSLAVGPAKRSMVVPKDALVLGGPKPVVWLVISDPDGTHTVVPAPVEVGEAESGFITVTGGLRAGDGVVIRGNERLRPGQKVAPQPAGDGGE